METRIDCIVPLCDTELQVRISEVILQMLWLIQFILKKILWMDSITKSTDDILPIDSLPKSIICSSLFSCLHSFSHPSKEEKQATVPSTRECMLESRQGNYRRGATWKRREEHHNYLTKANMFSGTCSTDLCKCVC